MTRQDWEGVTVSVSYRTEIKRDRVRFDNSMMTSKPLEQSGNNDWICRGLKHGLPQISWRSGNRERAEVAASVLSWSVSRAQVWGEVRVEEERDTNCWSQCQRGQDSTEGRKGEYCPSFYAMMREKGKERVDTDDE